MTGSLVPLKSQEPLPLERLLRAESPGEDALPMDVLIVGGGPAGLACAIRLKQLNPDLEVGVLEKAAELGGHSLSGAVVNPIGLRTLFPTKKDEEFPLRGAVTREEVRLLTKGGNFLLPTPPTMKNHGNYIASLCEVVRWMGEQAEGLGVNLFPGYPAESLLIEGTRVLGARTTAQGLNRDGSEGSSFSPPTDVAAQVTVLAEGTRGSLAQGFFQWQGITSPNPQIYALGVKEIWEVKKAPEAIIHTMGWPLPPSAFGGSFCYPLANNLIAIGLVVGLDYRQAALDVHALLQQLKTHPVFASTLEGGTLVEWGAKTIPEGGFHSFPSRFTGDGCLVVGDSAGFVDVPSLKGIHYAMLSGIMAAETIFEALSGEADTSAEALNGYDRRIMESAIREDLYATRNMRLAFKGGFYAGGFKAGLMSLTKGSAFGGMIHVEEDAAEARTVGDVPALEAPAGSLAKLDAVFHAGNQTRDDIPSHLIIGTDISPEMAQFYAHMCPAGVYEEHDGKLVVNAPNCIDCKATDVVGPRWTPREGGSGPSYKRM